MNRNRSVSHCCIRARGQQPILVIASSQAHFLLTNAKDLPISPIDGILECYLSYSSLLHDYQCNSTSASHEPHTSIFVKVLTCISWWSDCEEATMLGPEVGLARMNVKGAIFACHLRTLGLHTSALLKPNICAFVGRRSVHMARLIA